jgi:hypothetical protein
MNQVLLHQIGHPRCNLTLLTESGTNREEAIYMEYRLSTANKVKEAAYERQLRPTNLAAEGDELAH